MSGQYTWISQTPFLFFKRELLIFRNNDSMGQAEVISSKEENTECVKMSSGIIFFRIIWKILEDGVAPRSK